MNIKQLIEVLQTLPEDLTVYRVGGEYNGDYRQIGKVTVPAFTLATPFKGVILE